MNRTMLAASAMLLLGACAGTAEQKTTATLTDPQGRVSSATTTVNCTRSLGMPLPPGCQDPNVGYGGGGYYTPGYYGPNKPYGVLSGYGPKYDYSVTPTGAVTPGYYSQPVTAAVLLQGQQRR